MGRAKSLLRFGGTTFLERVTAVVRQRAERTVLLGDGPAPPMPPEIARLSDVPGLAGPLAGILAALRWRPDACWLIAACDLPGVRVEALDWLLSRRRPEYWAILPKLVPPRVEPLLAVYEPESAVLLEQIAASGQWSPHTLADMAKVHSPMPPAALRDCWININTPDQLQKLGRDPEE